MHLVVVAGANRDNVYTSLGDASNNRFKDLHLSGTSPYWFKYSFARQWNNTRQNLSLMLLMLMTLDIKAAVARLKHEVLYC